MSEILAAALAAREKVLAGDISQDALDQYFAVINPEAVVNYNLALAWIAEARDYLEAYAETMRDSTQEWDRDIVARLDSLLARVGR